MNLLLGLGLVLIGCGLVALVWHFVETEQEQLRKSRENLERIKREDKNKGE